MTAVPGELGRLIEQEQRLDAALTTARAEAAATVTRAREEAAALERLLADDVALASAAQDATLEAEHRAAVEAIRADAGRAVARFDDVTPGQVAVLAGLVVARLTVAGAGP